MKIALTAALCLVFSAAPARGETDFTGTFHLRYSRVDLAVTGAGLALWLTSELALKRALAPSTCRWCDRAADGTDTLNGLDAAGRSLRWGAAAPTADTLSNWVGVLGLPLGLIAFDYAIARADGVPQAALVDALILTEVVALSSVLNQAVKFAVGRERPFVHALPASERPLTEHPEDNNVSFYSGHTSYVFSLAFGAATVAALRNYSLGRWVWLIGLPVAAATAYFRIAADKHYLTDVLVGAASGTAFGLLVPTLIHPREGGTREGVFVRVVPTGSGAAVVGVF